jgi:prepilin-type N-terminal cleavage/methylation domain-containing protein
MVCMNTLRRMRRDDSGFTLIEVLTVSAIIGILSSIAIPIMKAQTNKGQAAAAVSDLRNTATAMESYFTDHGTYGAASELAADGLSPAVSKGTTIVIVSHSGTNYCLASLRNTPMPTTVAQLQSKALRWYDSAAGGVQYIGATSCPTTSTIASDWQTDLISN